MALTEAQMKKFRAMLEERRQTLIVQARKTLESDMILSPDDRFDEVDQASSEYMQAFSFRLRGREKFLMDWGGGDLEDLESAVDYLKSLPYVDGSRIGIWGSSYGGTLTVYSLLKKPGLFAAGVAGAPAVDPHFFGSDDVAIVRLEQIYPFPKKQFDALIKKYGKAELVWVQEEPANMGAWSHIAVNQPEYGWKCVSRRAASSPATGFPKAHEKEQGEIVEKALGI